MNLSVVEVLSQRFKEIQSFISSKNGDILWSSEVVAIPRESDKNNNKKNTFSSPNQHKYLRKENVDFDMFYIIYIYTIY